MIDNEDDKQASYRWFDIRERDYVEFRVKLVERIHALEKLRFPPSEDSLKSGHSGRSKRSSISQKSKASSACSLRLEAAIKTTRLKAEMSFFERDNELRRMHLLRDIAIAEAKIRKTKKPKSKLR